jgi:hypothetical protein
LKEKPDLIVCDIMMPELDGYGVLHLLRKNPETQSVPFIFLTAKTDRTDLRKGMEMGADDYITKPFEDIELLNAIEVRLKKAEVFDQKYSLSPQGISQFLKDVKDTGILDKLAEQYSIETYTKKQTLYQEGKRPRFLYFLVKGKVKATRMHEDGKEYITDIFSEGDFMGYPALIEEINYGDSAVVLEDADIMQIPKEDFLQMIYGGHQCCRKIYPHHYPECKRKRRKIAQPGVQFIKKAGG